MTTVEVEKAEAMRRFNNRRILRTAAVAFLCFLCFPTVVISLKAGGDWFYCTGAVFITVRSVIFVFVNILVALIFVLSCANTNESTSSNDTEPYLYDQYTSSSNNNESNCSSDTEPDLYEQYTSIVTASAEEKVEDDDDSNKQIVPAFASEVEEETIRQVMEFRRTESAKVVATEWLSSEEFQLKVETRMMALKKRSLTLQKNDLVQYHEPGLVCAAPAGSGYGSC